MAGEHIAVVVVAGGRAAAVAVAVTPVGLVVMSATSVPGETAAGTSPVVVIAMIAPAIVIRSVVRAPIAVAAPVPVIPGIIPCPAAVPERVTPAPAIPGVIPPGVVPCIVMTPGRIPAVVVAGSPPRVVPRAVPSVIIYVYDIACCLGFVESPKACFVCLVVVECVHIHCVLVSRL